MQWSCNYSMVFDLYLKYAQNGLTETDCDVYLEPYFTSHSSHAALNQKRKISDSRAFASYVERLYTPYTHVHVVLSYA